MLFGMDLHRKRAMVTGSSRRIGKAIALSLAKAGAELILHYNRSENEAEELAADIHCMGGQAIAVRADLSDSEACGEWFAGITEQAGGVDILVNSASEFPEDRYGNLNARELGRSMAVHLLSPLSMMREMMKTGRKAVVVNILDARVLDRDPLHTSYHLSKSALLTATRELAVEMAPQLRINAVAPGLILPPEGKGEQWIEDLKNTNPLNDRGRPEDIADAVLYFCRADFVTGNVIFVDGGRHLKGRSDEL